MNIKALFAQFASKKVAIVGDVMIDAYMMGKVHRVSPEAPVPIVSFESHEERLGGAANVAMNIKALGATPFLVSVIGNDRSGDKLLQILKNQGMPTDGMLQSEQRKTTIKTRVMGNHQHLLRIDTEQIDDISAKEEQQLEMMFSNLLNQGIDVVIFEDYNKGVLTENIINKFIALAKDKNVFTTVDPKKDNFFAYKNVDLFKPNLKELKEALNLDFKSEDKVSFENAVEKLRLRINCKHTFITLSEHGVFIQSENEKKYIPAHIRNIADVSGAGDTVISVASLCLASNLTPELVAGIANLAGGLVCEESGVVPIDLEKLKEEILLNYKDQFEV